MSPENQIIESGIYMTSMSDTPVIEDTTIYTREILPVFTHAESTILSIIRKNQGASKVDLIRMTDYSRSKITGCINSLIEGGFIHTNGLSGNTGGRRSVIYTLHGNKGLVFGADIGATSIDLIITDLRGKRLARYEETGLVKHGPRKILSRICVLFDRLMEENNLSEQPVLAFGIGVPGPVDFKRGLVVSPPIMPGWDQFPIIPFINDHLPDTFVVVDNDVNIMALGESVQGIGIDKQNIIFVKIGTGIGAGIICEGKVYHGTAGCAGDIGHICMDNEEGPFCPCGNRGCLEVLAGGEAIARHAAEAVKNGTSEILKKYYDQRGGEIRAEDIGSAAREGDPVSIKIIRESGKVIGEVMAGLVNFYNPGMIVIGGGVSNLGNILLSSIHQAILKRSLPLATKDLPVVFSLLKEDAGVIGAINLALDVYLSMERVY